MSEAKKTKVLIVDDHESMRDSFEREFCPENGFLVTGSIKNAAEAEAECIRSRPELVIMDVCTENGESGLDAAAAIKKRFPNIKIIVTSGFDEITYMPRAKQLGANAFVYKSKSLRHFGEVARRVLGGEYVFPESKIIPTPQGESPLTEREMEVLALMCRHMSAKQIAEELYITERTVKFHRENMLAKTGFSNGLDLAFYVISNGWINPNF